MSEDKETSQASVSGGGTSFLSMLAVAFIVLKLLGYISWSWWWVTAPLWGPVTLLTGLFLLFLPFAIWKGTK